jgi:hypothetical protein
MSVGVDGIFNLNLKEAWSAGKSANIPKRFEVVRTEACKSWVLMRI